MAADNDNEPLTVRGQVVLAPTVPPLLGATVHLYLEETSAADAPATRVAGVQLAHVRHRAKGAGHQPTILPFTIRLDQPTGSIDPAARYTLRAWVDADSDGKPGPNDLFSDQAYPVLTHGFGTWAEIILT